MKRSTTIAAFSAAVAAAFAASAGPANAAVTSGTIQNQAAILNLDGADDNVTVSAVGGVLSHGQVSGGLASATDWDSATPNTQTVPANGTFAVAINGGGGNDVVSVLTKVNEVGGVTLKGDAGDDVLTGADSKDVLLGGTGNDRLVGAKGDDKMGGDEGNDTLVWNNGDNTDVIDGNDGNDTTEVNGNALGDVFTVDPNGARFDFKRTNLVTFSLDASTEHLQVNGLGGNDSLTASNGLAPITLLSADGGAGNDTVKGGDGPDTFAGGEGNDVLGGGDGDDRLVGDRGADTMDGSSGDDTLVWNNGDGTDVMNGEAGSDDVEVNGAPTADDMDTVDMKGQRIVFNRSNLVPFGLDIGTAETLHVNGLGGNDTIAVGEVGGLSTTVSGGSDGDTLTGAGSSETFNGGSGGDQINPGGGLDVVNGDDGRDRINIRDRTADVARGGTGDDSVTADRTTLDIVDGFEEVDRTPNATPKPVDTSTKPVVISGRTVKVGKVVRAAGTKRIASIRVTAPAGTQGNSTGRLALRTSKPVKIGGVRAVLRIGSARYDLAPGTSQRVKVKLTRGVERLAGRNGHLRVRAEASTGASGKTAISSKRLTLALGRASGSRR